MDREAHDWTEVAEAILRGLTHELNNRVLALTGVRELAGDGMDEELTGLFDGELARLEAAVGMLRRLTEPTGPEEVLEASTVLDGARLLHGRNSLLRGLTTNWTVAEHLPAVRVAPVAAERGLVAALSAAGVAARAEGVPLEVSVAAEGGAVVVGILPAPPANEGRASLEAAGAAWELGDGRLRVRFVPA